MNLDIISFAATAPGAVGVNAPAVAGDPAAVRNAAPGSNVFLVAQWTNSQGNGFSQITFPSGHDLVRNIRYRTVVNAPYNIIPQGVKQVMRPQDPLVVTQAGSAVAGDVETVHSMFLYENLPGVNASLIDSAELASRGTEVVTIEDTTTATVAATYSGPRALNAASDLLKANTDYAILGAVVSTNCGALTIRGVDTGNLRAAIPGLHTNQNVTSDWFVNLSDWLGMPTIPVINSANKAGIFIENITNENLAAVPFSLILVQLSPK